MIALKNISALQPDDQSKGTKSSWKSQVSKATVISSRAGEKFGPLHCLGGCLLLLAILVNCSALSGAGEAKKGDAAELLVKEFNLAFSNFVTEFKTKNPQFNLSSVRVDSQLQQFRDKREVSLEEELEYALKKEPKGLFSSSSNYNSLETAADESATEENTCLTCKPNEALRKRRIEQIKQEILRKMNLAQAPQVNISAIPRQMILQNFLNDPMYQNDQSFDDYANDDDEMQVKQVITFAEKGNYFFSSFR